MKYVKAESKKVFLEWDIGVSAEYNLKTQYSLVAPRFSLTDVLSLPQSMAANGRMLPNLPRLLSVLLVSVLSQNRGTTHMMVRAFTNHDYHPSCQCLWQGRKYEHGQVLLRLVGLFQLLFCKRAFRNPLLVRALKPSKEPMYYLTLSNILLH